GRQLAGAVGLRGFTTEMLETPELNVHLGTRFLSDLFRRYDADIPLVLSAYNAGPTRANRWRRLPEAGDPHRFTERIPFAETRGYVKSVTRNRALYRWLYANVK
ncbi:MAG: lytic transglycosylase domain-containing protein, partial [Gemmatimonadetes bacterium]|nr:lytic transglycosylase domain-containing protein [Gemmatimonadota bacterium]